MAGVGLLVSLFIATAVLANLGAEDRGPGGRYLARRYTIDATVLQSGNDGPELCAGLIARSLPPQCGGFPLEQFRWEDVPTKRSVHGTTWADLHLVGTFDGHAFVLTAKPSPAGPPPPAET